MAVKISVCVFWTYFAKEVDHHPIIGKILNHGHVAMAFYVEILQIKSTVDFKKALIIKGVSLINDSLDDFAQKSCLVGTIVVNLCVSYGLFK